MAGISINLGGNFSKLDELKDKAGKTAKSIKAAFDTNLGKAAFAGLAAAAAASFAAVTVGAKKAIEEASDLAEVISKTEAVFKSSAGSILAWSDGASRAFGQSKREALEAASSMGNLFTAMGIIPSKAAEMSKRLVELASDLASFNNTSPEEAVLAIGSALRGEAEPIQRYGVLMNEATLKAQAFASGLSDGKAALDPATKALAAYELVIAKTATAQGDFARTQDGLANSQRILNALIKDATAEVGKGLLPVTQDLVRGLKEADFEGIAQKVTTLTQSALKLASALARVARLTPAFHLGKAIESSMNDGGNLTADDKKKAAEMAGQWAARDPAHMKPQAPQMPAPVAAPGGAVAGVPSGTTGTSEAAEQTSAALKMAAAAKEAVQDQFRARAAAMEADKIDSAILAARITGDAQRLASLEREKKIREEIKRLEGAGFTADEASIPAAEKVDGEAKAGSLESLRTEAAAKVDGTKNKLNGLQFQSTIGAISSMQRIGGGGGAVASGLDYGRQNSDMLRELNQSMRELVGIAGRDPDLQ